MAAGGGEINLHRRAGVELRREGAAWGKLGGRACREAGLIREALPVVWLAEEGMRRALEACEELRSAEFALNIPPWADL